MKVHVERDGVKRKEILGKGNNTSAVDGVLSNGKSSLMWLQYTTEPD